MKKVIMIILFFCLLMVAGNLFASEAGDIEIHGFISQGYMKSDDNNFLAETEDGTFQFNEMGINFGTWLTADLHLGMQFFARDLGMEGNDEIEVDWAYADYGWKEWLGFRVGKMKLVGGVYNEARDIDMMRTSALLPQSVYPELYRDTFTSIKGIGMYGRIPLYMLGSLAYTGQIGVLPVKTDGGFAKAFQAQGYMTTQTNWSVDSMDHDYYYTMQGKWRTPLEGLQLGGTYFALKNLSITGALSSTDNPAYNAIVGLPYYYDVSKMDGVYYSAEYAWDNLLLISEYTYMDIEGQGFLAGNLFMESDVPLEGWYCSASYRFTHWFELGAGYSEYYPREKDKKGEVNIAAGRPDFLSWLKDTTVSLRFDLNESWILKLEAHRMNGFGAFSTVTNVDFDQNWMLYVAKMTFSF